MTSRRRPPCDPRRGPRWWSRRDPAEALNCPFLRGIPSPQLFTLAYLIRYSDEVAVDFRHKMDEDNESVNSDDVQPARNVVIDEGKCGEAEEKWAKLGF